MQHYTRGQPLSQIRNLHNVKDPTPDLNLWSWGPMKNHLLATPADKGYKSIPRTEGTVVQASIMSQLYDFDLVMPQNKAAQAMMWAKEEDIARAEECPVILCHALDYKPKHDHIYLLGPLPIPLHGSYAFVAEGENLILYFIEDTPENTRAKYNQVRQKIIDLASAAKPDDIEHMWANATALHRSVANEDTFQLFQQETISRILNTRDQQQREEYEQRLNAIQTFHSQILMIDRLLQLSDYQEHFQEITHMMQDLAAGYYAFHLSRITAQTQQKKDMPPAHAGITNGKLLVPYCFPLYVASEAIQNAASGADRWENPDRQPPFYARKSGNNTTTIEYGRESEQQVFEEKAVINLYKEVKNHKDTDIDFMLYTLSAIIKETNGEGAAWVWASKFLDDREIKPITKNTNTSMERRAGHRAERLAEIDEAVYRLSGLWINIREYIPPKRKGGKTRVFTHRGRLWAVMETWTQNTLGENGETQERIPVAWKIKAGDWLMEYLGPARRYVGYLCDQALKYDPYHQQDEKRLAYYFLFFLRFNAKNNDSFLVREIGDLLKACTLTPNARDPQKARNRFEKAMDVLKKDGIIDDWEYVAKSQTELPAKKWLPVWLQWQVKIYVRARLEPPKR